MPRQTWRGIFSFPGVNQGLLWSRSVWGNKAEYSAFQLYCDPWTFLLPLSQWVLENTRTVKTKIRLLSQLFFIFIFYHWCNVFSRLVTPFPFWLHIPICSNMSSVTSVWHIPPGLSISSSERLVPFPWVSLPTCLWKQVWKRMVFELWLACPLSEGELSHDANLVCSVSLRLQWKTFLSAEVWFTCGLVNRVVMWHGCGGSAMVENRSCTIAGSTLLGKSF